MGSVVSSVLKGIILKLATEKFLTWLFIWVAELIAASTKTTKDDEFVAKAKEVIQE